MQSLPMNKIRLHLSRSGFQYPGSELWLVAVPTVLHVRFTIWGEMLRRLTLPFTPFHKPRIMCDYTSSWW